MFAYINILKIYLFGIAGEKLTMRLRVQMFTSMLRQEIGWYDQKENGVGALCSRLSSEAAQVQGVLRCTFPITLPLLLKLPGHRTKNRNSHTVSFNNNHRCNPSHVLRMEIGTGGTYFHAGHAHRNFLPTATHARRKPI